MDYFVLEMIPFSLITRDVGFLFLFLPSRYVGSRVVSVLVKFTPPFFFSSGDRLLSSRCSFLFGVVGVAVAWRTNLEWILCSLWFMSGTPVIE